jgi:pimeloyl-ACP methyl ester carboxylesterase
MAGMAESKDNSTYIKVAGASHLVHDDAPDEYRGAVEAFLCARPAPWRNKYFKP